MTPEKEKALKDEAESKYPLRYGDIAARAAYIAGATAEAEKNESNAVGLSFQNRVNEGMQVCFGAEISKDKVERNHRFIEEALELVQSLGATKSECHQLVDYVFDRNIGEPVQEAGGVMVTLAALCLSQNMNMDEAGELELKRIWTKVDAIREKQAAKPKHSPLPI